MAVDSASENNKFLRQLTSSDKKTRKDALDALRLYLSRTSSFTELDLLKLWKGFFYCMWLTANPLPQHRLAQDLSSLVTQAVARPNVLPFVDAFWKTMAREWPNIDSLRLDKYLRLCRLILYETFDFLKNGGLRGEEIRAHNDMLRTTALNSGDLKIPNGLRHHVLDVYVDGLEHLRDGHAGLSGETVRCLLEPVVLVKQRTKTSSVRKRAGETLADARLEEWNVDMQGMRSRENQGSTSEDAEFDGFD